MQLNDWKVSSKLSNLPRPPLEINTDLSIIRDQILVSRNQLPLLFGSYYIEDPKQTKNLSHVCLEYLYMTDITERIVENHKKQLLLSVK